MEREVLTTADAVIDALGGTGPTAQLTGRSPQAVSNWRAVGRLPSDLFLLMSKALERRHKTAPVSVWGMVPANGDQERAAS